MKELRAGSAPLIPLLAGRDGAARPEAEFVVAATVVGILANDSEPAHFLYDNLLIAANIVHAAHATGVEKLLFLGSSCIYPRLAPQPIPEDALLPGPLGRIDIHCIQIMALAR